MKKQSKKLSITAETVRVLSKPELGAIAGGTHGGTRANNCVETTAMTCTTSVIVCPPGNSHRTDCYTTYTP